ncbi:MAG: TonB-dependent receptor [Calditrichaceae bacterium]|nr:TonB-dependent receptor [Calditrichaceae bacterium]MBN2709309.1 TonB-dependent receptor [Calditrichaceae bacterium]RQV91994.1 MAG: TonB-dependent receptor [Calditrichota bacterium]
MRNYLILMTTLFIIRSGFCQTGSIQGQIFDAANRSPLAGVNITVEDINAGAATDEAGRYIIKKIPVGIYTIHVVYMGYQEKIIPDIVVKSNQICYVNTELSVSIIDGETITVSSGYYAEPYYTPVSMYSLSQEEIRRSPGAREDISRVLQNMAGVNFTSDDRNDLVVRGGSPTEVLFLVDDMEIPNPNHFGTQGGTGGPINLINAELIDDVFFMAGGFTSQYGSKSSAVVGIKLRQGNRQAYNGKLDLSFGGVGGYLEGPLNKGQGSFVIGFHRSFLELFEDVFGYNGVPVYSNIQGKLDYDLSNLHKMSILIIGGDDKIDIGYEIDADDFKPNQIDTVGYDPIIFSSRQLIGGINLHSYWSNQFYTTTSLYHVYSRFDTDVNYHEIAGIHYTGNDKLQEQQKISEKNQFYNKSTEQISAFNLTGNWQYNENHLLTFGGYVKLNQFTHDMGYNPPYINNYDDYGQLETPAFVDIRQEVTPKLGAFLNYNFRFWERFTLNAGLRYDYFKLIGSHSVDPRASLKYIISERLTFRTGMGIYHQNPEFIFITSHSENKNNLKDIQSNHFIAGLDYLLTPSIRLNIDVYHKDYSDYPVSADSGYSMLSTANSGADYGGNSLMDRLISKGKGRCSGFEVMLQKRMADKTYGAVSYSYSKIEHAALDGIYRRGGFDNRHVLNTVFGYRINEAWELSCKWRYAGGRPYTPFNRETSIIAGEGRLDLQRINANQYPDYHRLDIRADHREFYEKLTITTYLSVENIYDRKNVLSHYWNKTQQKTAFNYQTSLFFIGGVMIEF